MAVLGVGRCLNSLKSSPQIPANLSATADTEWNAFSLSPSPPPPFFFFVVEIWVLLNHLYISHRHLDEKADIAACEAFWWAMTHDSECIFTADFTANGSDATDVCASRSPRIPRRVSSVFYLLNIYRFTFNVAHVSRVFISDFLDFVFSLERSSFRPPPQSRTRADRLMEARSRLVRVFITVHLAGSKEL